MKAVITDYQYESIETERSIIEGAGFTLEGYQAKETKDLIPAVEDAQAVITQYADINAEVISHMKQARMIIKYGIGVNNIDCEAAAKKGIYVCNVPDYGVEEVSDHAVAMILALGKKLPILTEAFRNGDWGYGSVVPLYRLSECTVGLVGFGRIPQMAARKLKGFGMRILAYDPYASEQTAKEAGVVLTDMEQIIKESDFLSVHCPLTKDTRHIIGREEFRKMKSTAFVINTARGGIIDEAALIEALKEKEIAGAGIDVFEQEPAGPDNELLHLPNVIATPHSAWYSEVAITTLQRKVAEEVVNVLQGNRPFHCVNGL
ncbi:C-terminal binding protein [Lachnospiraceae bacterium ASD3451]|uniref:C-terminal binding protein n=1 Tax=Diplocloster agilis TaxID=2850323 RepID=UPI001DA77602|nr:C-terminal binding protein [Diplocloster agilis]MBU9746283.1 C-terminal binding protein [Diplocloster agilis]